MIRDSRSEENSPVASGLRQKAMAHLSRHGFGSLVAKLFRYFARKAHDTIRAVVLAPLGYVLVRVASLAPLKGAVLRLAAAIADKQEPDPFVRFDDRVLFCSLQYHQPSLLPAAFPGKQPYILTDRLCSAALQASLGPAIRSLEGLSPEQIAGGVFYTYFRCDEDALAPLREIARHGGAYVPHLEYGKTSYRFVNPLALAAMQKTWSKRGRVSHLTLTVHENICEALWITRHLEGDYVEIGVYLGGSALTALHFMDELASVNSLGKPRKAWLLDTYDGFNYEQAQSSADAIWAGTHALFGREKTMAHLEETFSETRTPHQLVPGNICAEPLPPGITKIAVANIDVDMYEPTLDALEKVAERVVPGGIIVCEDPASTPALYGALLAMDEFLESPKGSQFRKLFKGGQYFLIKM